MDPNNERIVDLPGEQIAVTLDTDLNLAPTNPGDLPRNPEGGLVGLRIINDGTINLTLIFDTAAGPVFPVTAGDVIVARIKQVNSGGSLTAADVIGLA